MTRTWTSAAVLVAGLMFAAIGSSAQAQTNSAKSDSWTFGLTPYVWLAGLEGDVATIAALPPISVDAGFDDIIENIDFTLMVAAEARRGRFGLLADISYLSLSVEGDTPGTLFDGGEIESETLFATFAGAYRTLESDHVDLDLLAGLRLWYVETEIDLDAGLLPGQGVEDDEFWADPIIGLRANAALGHRFFLTGTADIGGFGVSSDFTWQVLGTLGYEFNDWFAARVGYRHLDVDYEDDGFLWDVAMSGPILGATFRF
jgi:hypothetical protein